MELTIEGAFVGLPAPASTRFGLSVAFRSKLGIPRSRGHKQVERFWRHLNSNSINSLGFQPFFNFLARSLVQTCDESGPFLGRKVGVNIFAGFRGRSFFHNSFGFCCDGF